MPVFVRTDRGDLRLTLTSGDEVLDSQTAATPQEANRVGIMMLASRDELHAGDTLTCRHADEAQSATVLRGPSQTCPIGTSEFSAGGDLTGPIPIACRVGNAFVPVIFHPNRTPEHLRFDRRPRKAKATPDEAIAYAARVLWYRQMRAAEKRRRLEAISHARYLPDTGRAA